MKLWKVVLTLAVLGAVLKALAPRERTEDQALTADRVVEYAQRTQHFPVDLGDGFRLDSIHAEGNAIISTVTLLNEPAGPADPMLVAMLRTASNSDTCSEIIARRQAYVDAGLRVVKRYLNSGGGEITRVVIDPAQCE